MEGRLQTTLVLAALEMAYAQRVPRGVIHHSDHGCQYTSIAFGKRCTELGVRPSMGSVGDCFDNAMAESFFSSLECEVLDRCRFETREEARVAVFSWIEGWYNTHRRHSSLGYLSPIEFEQAFIEGQSSGNPELLPLTRKTALREDPMRNRSKSEEVLENMMLTQRSH
jgi:putative transposase